MIQRIIETDQNQEKTVSFVCDIGTEYNCMSTQRYIKRIFKTLHIY